VDQRQDPAVSHSTLGPSLVACTGKKRVLLKQTAHFLGSDGFICASGSGWGHLLSDLSVT
jgi:hypothetical protein